MDKSYGELYDEELNAHIEQLEQAIGIMTTFKPTMEVDINHPVDMVLEVSNHIVGMKQRIAELETENCKIKQEAIISITALTNRCAELSIELTELREVTRPMTVHAEGWTP